MKAFLLEEEALSVVSYNVSALIVMFCCICVVLMSDKGNRRKLDWKNSIKKATVGWTTSYKVQFAYCGIIMSRAVAESISSQVSQVKFIEYTLAAKS